MEQEKAEQLLDEVLEDSEITTEELDWLLRGSTIRRPRFGVIPDSPIPQGISSPIDGIAVP